MKNKVLIATPALLVLAYFVPHLVSGQALFSVDTTAWTYVFRRWWIDGIASGNFSLWNPGTFTGMYLPASPGLGLFSPFNFFYFMFSSYLAHEAVVLLTAVVGAFGMLLLGRVLTGSLRAGVFAAIAYSLSGSVLSSVHNFGFFAGSSAYPWALWAYFRFCASPSVGRWVGVPIFLAWTAFEGDPLGTAILSIVILFDASLRLRRGERGPLPAVLAALTLAVGITAIVWWPALDAVAETVRSQRLPYEHASLFSLSPAQLLHWIAPGYWGYSHDQTFRGFAHANAIESERFWADSIYLGIPTLVFVGWAIFRKFKECRWLLFLAVFFLLLSLGKYGGLHGVLYDSLPGYSRLRFPERFYTYFNLFAVILATFGFADVERERSAKPILSMLAVGFLISAATLHLVPLQAALLQRNKALLLVAAIAIFAFLKRRDLLTISLAPFLIAIVAVDLFSAAPPLAVVDPTLISEPSGLGVFFQSRGNPNFRILRDGMLDYGGGPGPKRATLGHNWGVLEGMRGTFGYDPTRPLRLHPLLRPTVFEDLPVWRRIFAFEYILTPISQKHPALKEAHQRRQWTLEGFFPERDLVILRSAVASKPFEFYQRPLFVTDAEAAFAAVKTRGEEKEPVIVEPADLLFEGSRLERDNDEWLRWMQKLYALEGDARELQATASFLENTSDKFVVEYSTNRPAVLALRERFHPGWRAYLGNEEVPIVRVDYFNRAVLVPEGRGTLSFIFAPRSFFWGHRLSLASLFFLAGLYAVVTARRFSGRRGPLPFFSPGSALPRWRDRTAS